MTLARLHGNEIRSLPSDDGGFVPIDNHGRVPGVENVYAAGDGTNFPVKQGGIAYPAGRRGRRGDPAAAGAPLEPRPFKPILRGQLLTGGESRFMRTD